MDKTPKETPKETLLEQFDRALVWFAAKFDLSEAQSLDAFVGAVKAWRIWEAHQSTNGGVQVTCEHCCDWTDEQWEAAFGEYWWAVKSWRCGPFGLDCQCLPGGGG